MKRPAQILPIVLLVASGAWAQGTISSGDLEFTFHSDLTDPAVLNADLRWRSVDQLGQLWFWYRCLGDSEETALGAPDSQVYADGQANLQWSSVCSDTVTVEMTVVDCASEETCSVGGYLTIDAHLSSGMEAFFTYVDLDLDGTSSFDVASPMTSENLQIHLQDKDMTVDLVSSGSTYQVRPFSQLRTSLTDSSLTNLDDSGLPFGPGDASVCYQSGSDFQLSVAVGVSVFADGFEHGGTSLWSSNSDGATDLVISSFDTAEWGAGTVDTELYREGSGSLRWDHANDADGCFTYGGQPYCYLHLYPEDPLDLSAGEFISLWIHNDVPSAYNETPHPTYEEVVLELIYVNFFFDGGYYDTKIRLDFVGWKRYVIDKNTFLGSTDPAGWGAIDHIAMFVTNVSGPTIPERTVHLDNLLLSSRPPGNVPARFLATFETGSFDPDIGNTLVLGQHVVDPVNNISEYRFPYATIVDNPVPSALNPSAKVFQSNITEEGYARAEYQGNALETDEKTLIYAWKEFFPSTTFNEYLDWNWMAFGQWKTYPCEEYTYPHTNAICGGGGIFNDRGIADWHANPDDLEFRFRAEPDCIEVPSSYETDIWTTFVLEVYWTNTQKGYYHLYKNGALLDERTDIKTLFDTFEPGTCDMRWALGAYVDWIDLGAGSLVYYLDDMAVFDVEHGVTIEDVLAWQE